MSSTPQSYTSSLTQKPPLVPSEVIEKKQDTVARLPEPFLEFLKKLTGRLRKENCQHNNAMWAKHLTNENFYRGNQYGTVSKTDGTWLNFNRASKLDPRYTHNLIGGHVDAIAASHILARTDLEVIPTPTDDASDHAQGVARSCGYVVDHYEQEIFTETFRIRESKLRQFGGGVARYSFWDAQAGKQKVKRPKMEQRPMAVDASPTFTCSVCGESDTLDKASAYRTLDSDLNQSAQPECPYCQSNELAITQPEQVSMPQVAGYDEIPTGDCRTISVPMYQLDFDRTGMDFYDALWLKWTRRFRPEVIKQLVPFWKSLSGSTLDGSEDYGERVGESLRNSAGNTQTNYGRKKGGQDAAAAPKLVTAELWWIQPAMYADAPVLREDFKIGDPKNPSHVVPAGSRFIDEFPDGMKLLMVEKEAVDFDGQDFRQAWVYIPFSEIPSKIEGDGIENMLEPQREINKIDALIFTDIRMTAAPPTYYEELYVKNKDLVGRPDVNVPVKPLPKDKRLDQIFYTPQGRQMPPHVPAQRQWLAQVMQWQSKVSNTSTGQSMLAEQTGERTATGARLVAEGAQAQRAPETAAMSDGDVRTARIWLRLFKENAVDGRYIPLRGKSSAMEGVWLKGTDLGELESEVMVVARPGSNTPRSPEDKQNALGMAFQVCGGPQGVLMMTQTAPEMLKSIEDIFQVKFNVSEFDLDARQSRMRMDAMKRAEAQAAQIAEQMQNPLMAVQTILQSAPIGKYDAHEAAMAWLVQWLKQDEGMTASELLRAAAEARIEEHKAAMQGLQQEQVSEQQQLEAPLRQQAMEDQAMQADQQMQQQDAQAEQQAAMEGAKAEQAMAMKQADNEQQLQSRVIDEASKEEDHRRNLELEQVRQGGAEKIARQKGSTKT